MTASSQWIDSDRHFVSTITGECYSPGFAHREFGASRLETGTRVADGKLSKAYSDVQRDRDQLVQLEAEKLRGVEKVRNKDQLQNLKKCRSSDQSSSR